MRRIAEGIPMGLSLVWSVGSFRNATRYVSQKKGFISGGKFPSIINWSALSKMVELKLGNFF